MAKDAWTDEEILLALDLTDYEGMQRKQVGARLGRSKGSVIGIINRITNDTDASDPDGNQNGTMPRLWWRKGRAR